MIILGIESATDQVGCALGGNEGVLAEFRVASGRRHAETLAPAIEFACAQARIQLKEIRAIAVDVGPGLFTGLRVGISTAKAMALALRVPMIGLPSLDLLAYPFRRASRVIVPVIDAKRGEVFSASYRGVPGGMQRVSDYDVIDPEQLASELAARTDEYLLVGDGVVRYAELFEGNDHIEVAPVWSAAPSAAVLVELAHPRALREEFVQPAEIQPMYMRKADAQINWSMRETA